MFGSCFPPPDGGPWVEFVVSQYPAGKYVSIEKGVMRSILQAYLKVKLEFSTTESDDLDKENEDEGADPVLQLNHKYKPVRHGDGQDVPQKRTTKAKVQERTVKLRELEGGVEADEEDNDDDVETAPNTLAQLSNVMAFQQDMQEIQQNVGSTVSSMGRKYMYSVVDIK